MSCLFNSQALNVRLLILTLDRARLALSPQLKSLCQANWLLVVASYLLEKYESGVNQSSHLTPIQKVNKPVSQISTYCFKPPGQQDNTSMLPGQPGDKSELCSLSRSVQPPAWSSTLTLLHLSPFPGQAPTHSQHAQMCI